MTRFKGHKLILKQGDRVKETDVFQHISNTKEEG